MKLFVGNISWNTDEDGLRNFFSPYGALEEVRIVTDRETGRSRGFGFVTFSDRAAAQRAIDELNGTSLDGRQLNINQARERQPRRQNTW